MTGKGFERFCDGMDRIQKSFSKCGLGFRAQGSGFRVQGSFSKYFAELQVNTISPKLWQSVGSNLIFKTQTGTPGTVLCRSRNNQ